MRITTVAKTKNPPPYIALEAQEELKLAFVDENRKIDLFRIGTIKPKKPKESTDSNDPDNIDFDSLTLESLSIFSPEFYGITEDEKNNLAKIQQLGLLFFLCNDPQSTTPPLILGVDKETDSIILDKLHAALSDNILNKEEVIREFVQYWNDIAALPIAKHNWCTKSSSDDDNDDEEINAPIFTYHGDFPETVRAFLTGYNKKVYDSPLVNKFFGKLFEKLLPPEAIKDLSPEQIKDITDNQVRSLNRKAREDSVNEDLISALMPQPMSKHSKELFDNIRKMDAQIVQLTDEDANIDRITALKLITDGKAVHDGLMKQLDYDNAKKYLDEADVYRNAITTQRNNRIAKSRNNQDVDDVRKNRFTDTMNVVNVDRNRDRSPPPGMYLNDTSNSNNNDNMNDNVNSNNNANMDNHSNSNNNDNRYNNKFNARSHGNNY